MASPIITQTEEKKKPEKKKSEEPNFWDDFDEEREQEKTDHSGKSAIDIEISRYLECSLCPRQNDPFAWWRENEVNYPNIAKVAKTSRHPCYLRAKRTDFFKGRRNCVCKASINQVKERGHDSFFK